MENKKNNNKISKEELFELQVDYVINCLKEADEFATKNNVERAKVVK